MLFPHESSRQITFCAAIERQRYSNIRAEANRPKPPQPFIWQESGTDELTLIPNPNILEKSRTTPIDIGEGSEPSDFLGEMIDQERLFQSNDRVHLQDAYRKGFTAGCVLLACYIYDSNLALGHKSSKARGEFATVELTGMKAKSVQNFFREFNSVAHFWGAYHISAPDQFLIASKNGIKEYTKKLPPLNFLDEVNFEYF
jgi:hypothetical protein